MICDKIMLIRHAERPSADKSVRGVTQEGVKNKEELTVRGWQRAARAASSRPLIIALFTQPLPGPIYYLRARLDRKRQVCGRSILSSRSPTCYKSQSIVTTMKARELVKTVLSAQASTVLISWKDNNMNVIANAILGNSKSAPQYWPFDRFDLVWIFDRCGGSWTFAQISQLLLAGDRKDAAS
jgi:hypothetical protein